MSKKIKRIIGLIVCLALSLCFFACNGEDIKISGKNRITLQAGQTYTIQASGIIGTDVKWTSSDESVATVSGGKVVAISQGEAVITVSEGKKSASVTVVVLDNRSYSVTVVGVDTYKVGYGEKIAKPADPVKAATAQYTYTFKGWYAGGQPYDFNSPVTANIVIEPVFDKTVNKYTVTVGDVQQEYAYGSQIVLEGELAAPTKEATAEYNYLFIGYYDGETKWDFANGVVTGDVTLTAKFQEIKRQYAVTFNGKAAEYYEYGAKLTAPAAPEKAATAQYTYVFKGWYVGDKKWNFDVDTVTETTELVAKYDEQINTYTVVVGDKTQTLDYGSKIAAPATPEKAATAKYTYTFAGWITEDGKVWDFAKDIVTGPVTLTASFNATVNQYDVIIPAYTVLENGEYKQIAASTKKVTFGEKVARPATPAKEGKDGKSYYFDKFVVKGTETEWNFEKDVVEGNVELEVLFKEGTDKFLVSFDGIRFEEYAYGEKIVRPETDPVKEPSVTTEYLFMGWTTEDGTEWDFDKDVVTENVNLVSAFGEKDRVYVIKFVVDGQELEETQEVKIGKKIEQPEGTPEKAPTKTKVYTFTGWYNGQEAWDFDKAIEGPVTLTARFAESVRKYTVTFESNEGTTTAQYVYGARIDRPEDAADYIDETLGKKAVFVGWTVGNKEWDFIGGTVTADITLTAKYELKDIYYNVTYLDENGALLFTHSAKNATEVIRLAAHEKATDARYVYTFMGWTADNETVYDFSAQLTADVVLTPIYDQTERIYTVTLVNYDGSVFKVLEGETGYTYGEKFYYPIDAEQPIKEIGDENSYVFDHWAIKEDGEAFEGEVIGNMILRAVYIIDNNLYTVKYYDYDGNLIEDATQNSIKRNKLLVLPDMEKAATLEERYTFLGWATEQGGAVRYPASNSLIRCSGNMEMYSVYKTETIYYTVTASVTDEDNTYYITDKNGNALTADDLSFTYNTKFEFKLAINTESMGSVAVNLNGNPMYANEDGVYSLYVRDNNNRIAITGLTIRRYTITGDVAIAKQNDENPMITDESDIVVKLTDGEEVSYVENAVNEGKLEIANLLKGDYTVEFVTRNAIGEFTPISTLKHTQELNANWAVANDTMTWTLNRSLVGLADITVIGKYAMDASGVVSPTENVKFNNLYINVNGANPGEGDFIASVSYDKCDKAQEIADGPSFGFTFHTESGVNLSVYFVDEGRIRVVGGPVFNWEPGHSPYVSGKLVCGTGAVGNMYVDCYRLVTVTFVKKNGNLYLFGSFEDKYNAVVPVSNKLMGYIDTATGTVYTAEVMTGSSTNSFTNRLHPTGEYQTYQHDEFKRLANITGMSADYGITEIAPVDVYGVRYSELPEDIDTYFARTETRFETTLDNHASLLVKNPTGSKTAVSVFNEATFTVVPDPGYRIKSVEFEGDYYPYYFNEKGQLVFEFRKDLGRYGSYKVNVVTEKGGIEGWTKYSGTFTIEGKPTDKAVAVFVGIDNGFFVGLYGDAEGNYSTYLPAGAYYMIADTERDTAGYAYSDIATPVTYIQYANVVSDGGALTKNVDFALMTGGLAIGPTYIGHQDVTWSGTSDKDFEISVHSFAEHSYYLNRKLADGQMISYSLKFNEDQGRTASGENKADWQDLYIKNNVGGKDLGMNSYGDRWGGDAVKTSPVRGLKQTLQQGFYNNVYNFAYARTGNTVYMLVKYEGAKDWVAVSKVNVTDAQAQIRLHISGRGGQYFDYTYSNFAFNGNAAEVSSIIDAACANVSTKTIRDIGTPGADGKYDTYIEGNYGLAISDQTFSKTTDTVTITANVSTYMQNYPFFGFVMRDPKTGNFVNIGMNGSAKSWITSVQNDNGWGYRSWVYNATGAKPDVDIGSNNQANPTTKSFKIKAVVSGDNWMIYVNDVLCLSLNLRKHYEERFIGGGGWVTGAASGNAKHGWTGDTANLYPVGDEYQLGFFVFADTQRIARIEDITVEKKDALPTMFMEGLLPEGIESVKNAEDVVYTGYNKGNTEVATSAVGIVNGESMQFTMKFNPASEGRLAHGAKYNSTGERFPDMYYQIGIGGKGFRFNAAGCTTGSWDNTKFPSATVVTNNVFDFGLGRDMYEGNSFTAPQYDFAIVKENGKVDLYGKWHGATEWIKMYTSDNTQAKTYIDYFTITTKNGFAINYSLYGFKVTKANEVTAHTWDYKNAPKDSWYSSASKVINEDGAVGYTMHLNTTGLRQWNSSVYLPKSEVYHANGTNAVITGNYSIRGSNADWSMYGWHFRDTVDGTKSLFLGFRSGGQGKNYFVMCWNTYVDNYGYRYPWLGAADAANGLNVCNPNAIAGIKNNTVQFSAKWVVNGYDYKLYIGEYGKEADTLVFDINVKTYTTNVAPVDGGDVNKKWGGTHEHSADKHIPDLTNFRVGVTMSTDVGPKDTDWNAGAFGAMYAENVTVRDNIWTGDDITLTGPAYKLITDENGNRITSDYWYAEADFEGSAQGRSWAGILTDMMGQSAIQTADKNTKTDFYGTGYGYGQVFIHKAQNEWFNGTSYGAFAVDTSKPIKIASARIENRVYAYVNDTLFTSYVVSSDKPSQFGVYAGTGSNSDAIIKNFKYVLGAEEVEKKMRAIAGATVNKTIEGKTFALETADLGGGFTLDNGIYYKSFGANYALTGRNSLDMDGITFAYQAAHTGNVYYMEAEFDRSKDWQGILINTYNQPASDNGTFLGVGFGYGNDKETQIFIHTTHGWGPHGDKLCNASHAGNVRLRLGVARIYNSYYIFVDGKYVTALRSNGIDTQDKSKTIAADNESGFGVFNEEPAAGPIAVRNAYFSTDEATVRAICATVNATGDQTEYVDYSLTEKYVVSGKIDITNPLSGGNRWIGFNTNGGNNRFLLWDSDKNDTFELAYSVNGQHVHMGNLPASEYITATTGAVTTLDWKIVHDGKNAYFFINGEPRMIYVNAILSKGVFMIEKCNVSTKVYNVTSAKEGSAAYAAEVAALASYQAMFANDTAASMYRVQSNGAQYNLSGSGHWNWNTRYGMYGNYVFSTTLVIESVSGNAHFGFGPSDSNRFLFWNTGEGNTFKATWAYETASVPTNHQFPAEAGTYNFKFVVKDGNGYWFVNDNLICGIKWSGGLDMWIESMTAHTENTTLIYGNANQAEYNAAIAGLTLPAISGPTRF